MWQTNQKLHVHIVHKELLNQPKRGREIFIYRTVLYTHFVTKQHQYAPQVYQVLPNKNSRNLYVLNILTPLDYIKIKHHRVVIGQSLILSTYRKRLRHRKTFCSFKKILFSFQKKKKKHGNSSKIMNKARISVLTTLTQPLH